MAISVTTPQNKKFGFIVNATSADISGCEELKAAPGAGYSIVVDAITVNNAAGAQSITVGYGLNVNTCEGALLGPMAMAANTSLQWNFHDGMVLPANKSLTCDSSSNTACTFFVQGRII
jgi:hypothetical protein